MKRFIPFLILVQCMTPLSAKLITYKAPTEAPGNHAYEVFARETNGDWQPLFVYDAVVGPEEKAHCGFVSFDSDFQKPIELAIKRKGPEAKVVRVRPASSGIEAVQRSGNTFLTLPKPVKISVEFDGDIMGPLYVFANSLEANPITGPAKNVVYYGPGVHLLGSDGTGRIPIEAGTTVYIAGGAIVYGRADFGKKDNITIRGRGILCGTKFNHDRNQQREQMIYAGNSKNFTLDGITILDAPVWNMHLHQLTDSTIRNVKIIAWNRETDGIDPRSCQNLRIEDCFIRNGDDCVSIKLGNSSDPASATQRNRDIVVENCIFWPDKAHALLIGPEGACGGPPEEHVTEQVTFRNIDILRTNELNPGFYGAMAIMAADGQTIRDITFEDIRVAPIESGNLIDLRFVDNEYTKGFGQRIENIVFKNIVLEGKSPTPNRVLGHDEDQRIKNITITNLVINGEKVRNATSGGFSINEHVDELVFK